MANERIDSHYDTATCTKEHQDLPLKKLAHLHTKQAGQLRHRCAACAYEMGVRDGINQVLEQIEGERHERHSQNVSAGKRRKQQPEQPQIEVKSEEATTF